MTKSELIKLRRTIIDDLEYVLDIEQDCENKAFIIPWTREQHVDSLANKDCLHFIIENAQSSPVGFGIIFGLENPNGNIELRRIVISEKGKGYGTASIVTIQDLVFNELKAHRLWLDVKEQNIRARSLYSRLGFQYEGKLRECIRENNSFESLFIMSILQQEYIGTTEVSMDKITIKRLSCLDEANLLDHEFSERYPWYRQSNYFHECLQENHEGKRITLIATCDGVLAGCCHLLYESDYPYFREASIPEIHDLNVFPEFRRRGIASRLFDELEMAAAKTSKYIGLGVGLYSDYGHAQLMYGKRGYVMDGRGITYKNVRVQPGQSVTVDDDLIMYLVKVLH